MLNKESLRLVFLYWMYANQDQERQLAKEQAQWCLNRLNGLLGEW